MKTLILLLLSVLPAGAAADQAALRKTDLSDQVVSVSAEKDSYAVQFQEHAALYRLNNKNPEAAKIEHALTESRRKKKPVSLWIDALTMEIISLKK